MKKNDVWQRRLQELGVTFLYYDHLEIQHIPDSIFESIEEWIANYYEKKSLNKPTPRPPMKGLCVLNKIFLLSQRDAFGKRG